MLLISHRGNLNGPNPERENHPDYIDEAIKKGYPVEVDLWRVDGKLLLGHDYGQYEIDREWLGHRSIDLYVHCKNVEAMRYMNTRCWSHHYFWHKKDSYTLTSKGYTWCYPGCVSAGGKSISVVPETVLPLDIIPELQKSFYGICSDYVEQLDKEIE